MKLEFILKEVVDVTGITVDKMRSNCRKRQTVIARQLFCYTYNENKLHLKETFTLHRVGKYINKRHTNILYYIRKGEGFAKYDKEFKSMYEKIKGEIDRNVKESSRLSAKRIKKLRDTTTDKEFIKLLEEVGIEINWHIYN